MLCKGNIVFCQLVGHRQVAAAVWVDGCDVESDPHMETSASASSCGMACRRSSVPFPRPPGGVVWLLALTLKLLQTGQVGMGSKPPPAATAATQTYKIHIGLCFRNHQTTATSLQKSSLFSVVWIRIQVFTTYKYKKNIPAEDSFKCSSYSPAVSP